MIQMRWRQICKHGHWITLTLLLTMLVCVGIFQGQLFFSIAQKFQDFFLLTSEKPANDILIIKIDDKSLDKLGVFPWPRSAHAQMIKLLDAVKPKVIGYDVAFFEHSDNLAEDTQLSNAMKTAITPIVLPQELHRIENGRSNSQSSPLADFLGPNVFTGFINIFPDQDLLIRHFPTTVLFNNKYVSSFAEVIIAQLKDRQLPISRPTFSNYISIPDLNLYPSFSFVDVLDSKIPAEVFRNKIVLVGSTAATLHDEVHLPYQSDTVPGVYLHALYIDALPNGKGVQDLPAPLVIILILTISLLIFASKLFLRTSIEWIIGITLLAVITFLPFLLIQKALLTPLFYLYTAWLIATIVSSLLKIMLSEKEHDQLKNHFELYVNKSVVNELLKNPEKAVLGGEKREMTVLFSDIRSFTTISEQMSPQEVVHFLNEYLDMMTEIVLAQGGVLDKYIGDAIMAFWGAPLTQEDHALRGVRTAWKMQQLMKQKGADILRDWPSMGKLKIGIGLNSGIMAVGNMGSKLRFDYTVIGDNVNTASRIEGLTKYWRADILIPESTKKLVESEFLCRELDLVKVKGRSEPLRLFDIIGEQRTINEDIKKALLLFEDGIELYRSKHFKKAITQFQAWKQAVPQDTVVEVFIERCEDFIAHPTKTHDFTGVIVMDSK